MRVKLYIKEHNRITAYTTEISDGGDVFEKIALCLGMRADDNTDPLWYMSRRGCVRWKKIGTEGVKK